MTLGNLGADGPGPGATRRGPRCILTEALAVLRAAGDTWAPTWTLCGLAGLALRRGDVAGAVAAAREATTLLATHNDLTVLAEVLVTVGAIAAVQGQAETAARLFGAEAALREVAGPRMFRGLQPDRERAIAAARAALGEAAFAEAWAEGRAWSVARAAAEAETALGAPRTADRCRLRRARCRRAPPSPGCRRARSRCCAWSWPGRRRRRSRRRSSSARAPSPTHLTNVFAKLGVANRAEAVAWAVRNGLA